MQLEAPNDPQIYHRGRIHQHTAFWPTLGPFRHPLSLQMRFFCPKTCPTGRKASERPKVPWQCPKHHLALWLDGKYWYYAFLPILAAQSALNVQLPHSLKAALVFFSLWRNSRIKKDNQNLHSTASSESKQSENNIKMSAINDNEQNL